MPSIVFDHVDFSYHSPDIEIFRDLSLLIDTGWRTGLVGRNGRGKSTLLTLVEGTLAPLSGRIDVPVPVRRFVPESTSRGSTFDVVRNSVAPFTRWEMRMQAMLDADPPAVADCARLQELYQHAGVIRSRRGCSANLQRWDSIRGCWSDPSIHCLAVSVPGR